MRIPPVYTELKDLNLDTELVRNGRPNATIVVPEDGRYAGAANRVQVAIQAKTGVLVPVDDDLSAAGAVPISGHLIVLGNRSDNRTIESLYNQYYTLLDLRYPGPGGYEVRSLHNPFGNGHNVIFVGGSDAEGVEAAADVLAGKVLDANAAERGLSLGRLMEIELGRGIQVPEDIREFETWEASAGYGSVGYFGWNSISKRMAMYYMTGDAFHAREAIRLAFPDDRAMAEITEIDGERIENKDEPLSGPYHYNAHMMILYWDLIEESPVFTDDERLRVTNAFAAQFGHAQDQGARRRVVENVRSGTSGFGDPPHSVGSRHGQWSAISLYCLGRYFNSHYPSALWEQSMEAARWHFASLHHHALVDGEHDNLFWYNTGMAPVLSYMLLTGDRKPIENGVMANLLRGQEILASGREPDWALNSASIGFLNKAAYLTGDGRYREYLRRTGMDLDIFRLGQSFWPEDDIEPRLPTDLVNQWSIHPIPEPLWGDRHSGLPLEESYLFGSFRSAADSSGDFILVKGMNGASRNAYHTFVVLELRLDGETLLEGYLNQVLTRSEGMVEPVVAMDSALKYRDVVGGTAVVAAEVPRAAFCAWRRTLAQRVGRYALFVDRLDFRADSEELEVEFLWEGKGAWAALPDGGAARIRDVARICMSDPVETAVADSQARMLWRGAVEKGSGRCWFSLLAGDGTACARLAENAAALALPEPAVAVAGEYEGLNGDLVVLAGDHLHGVNLTGAALGASLFRASAPVQVDWDFHSGALELVADEETEIRLTVSDPRGVRVGGSVPVYRGDGLGPETIRIPAGRHSVTGAAPDAAALERVTARLSGLLEQGRDARRQSAAAPSPAMPDVPSISPVFASPVGGGVVDLVTADSGGKTLICAAEGRNVHVLSQEGEKLRTLPADGPIRLLHWWGEHGLLLAGCEDEKVIAFDPDSGDRKWVFVSEEDPAVFRAAKPYWFKTAPGHAGVHGLHSGVFLDGKSQAFVGSACTLEILDENGNLVKRLPVFWGPGSRFALIDGPEGSIDLLIARQPTDSHAMAVVNNRELDPKQRAFHDVPDGHTSIGGWACMSRKHIFYEDLDGDGRKEVVSEINGTWNRVTVWSQDGRALHNVHLGPGQRIPANNVRDFDVFDLDGDGCKELLAALSGGLILALDHRCEKVWSRRLPSPPAVMAAVRAESGARVVAGCEDGPLAVLDGDGGVVLIGGLTGRPTCIVAVDGTVVLATDRGEISRWRVDDRP
ncbi:MAG: VCBS repeat-containing protein [Gemmatimonadetes bacterium]|nr:VCBS repeat-containing protein [Gemmatimonadota bacterium]MDE3259628.1 VCBS repeat-containing protein [Gemmatimonadota bacterium]